MENETEAASQSNPNLKIASTLQRLASSNPHRKAGPGFQAGDFVRLCQYHNKSSATELFRLLRENEIDVQMRSTRMFAEISVAFEKRSEAFRILDDFKAMNPDTVPKTFSRDYDLVFLIFFATVVIAVASLSFASFNWVVPVAITTSGISISVVVEWLHRHYRLHSGMHFTIKEILIFTIVCGLNCAIWRLVF